MTDLDRQRAFLELTEADQMPAEARDLIEQARRRSFRMSHMIDELLASAVIDREG